MSLENDMKSGLLYYEYGHPDAADQKYEKVIEQQRERGKDLTFQYNHTLPSDMKTRNRLLKEILGDVGKMAWLEPPVHFSYGCIYRKSCYDGTQCNAFCHGSPCMG